jgi:hypothetical protein
VPANAPSPSVEQVKQELVRLRKWQALAHPSAVLGLSAGLRAHLTGGEENPDDTASHVVALLNALRNAIDGLGPHERVYAEADLNLAADHSYPTLSERQESLAQQQKCTAKTVRRHSARALDTLALLLVTKGRELGAPRPRNDHSPAPVASVTEERWERTLQQFWRLTETSRVDIVCSEIPLEERPGFASPEDRNYLRYAKFADLDSLIYVRTRLMQILPRVTVRDFSPSEYYDTEADTLVVIGGPPWNAKYREFLPQLPFLFEPHELGDDDPLVVPQLHGLTMGPRWTERHELLEDLAVFTRLTLAQGTSVFLLGGCLTLGVLGAAKCFLQAERGARNAQYVRELVGEEDFVLVTEACRVGGITDTADLSQVGPLLVLARSAAAGPFRPVVDNSDRYAGCEG